MLFLRYTKFQFHSLSGLAVRVMIRSFKPMAGKMCTHWKGRLGRVGYRVGSALLNSY